MGTEMQKVEAVVMVNGDTPRITPGIRVRIKAEYHQPGREGYMYAVLHDRQGGVKWVVVYWDDHEDPDVFKLNGLEVESRSWEDAGKLFKEK